MAGNSNSGRKSRTEEEEIIQKLSLLDDLFFERLQEALIQGKPYALRLFASHRIPKPSNILEVNHSEEQPLFDISYSINEVNNK